MRGISYRFTIFLITLAVAAAILSAGCTGASPEGQTEPAVTVSPTETQSVGINQVSVASAVTLGKMHGIMMEAIEEALAYPVLNSTEEKRDYETKISEFDTLADQFASETGPENPQNANIKDGFEVILVKKAKLTDDAETFFTTYESEGVITKEDVAAFEESVDDFTSVFGPFTKNYFDMVSKEESGSNIHARPALALLAMHGDIMEGIEEAFGYVLLGKTEEKDDFSQNMQYFDDAGKALVATGYLNKPENTEKLAAYNAMMQAKKDMQAAASEMFNQYESKNDVTNIDVIKFEIAVDNLTTAYDALLEEVLKEL
ncbi:MAG: hypothetical protein JXQ82_10395 [Methanomicrobiaceae archaeon]|nr:hypothetical protein [Methanomicrobiaceae archaeon]